MHKIADGGFLQTCPRRSAKQHALLREEQSFGFFGCAAEDFFEFLAAVRQHGKRLRSQNFIVHIYRARNKHAGHEKSFYTGDLSM
jgi:hypothetical protein